MGSGIGGTDTGKLTSDIMVMECYI